MIKTTAEVETAVVGAGPYGLSIAAHLRARAIDYRIFGKPMQSWRENMPKGMHLKSEGFASTLYNPESGATLRDYCDKRGIAYQDLGLPVRLDTFSDYGVDFQKRCVPNLDETNISSIQRCQHGFELRLQDGECLSAKKVIIATGLNHYENIPPQLSNLPREFVTHSSWHHDLSRFKGQQLAVIGTGASAVDVAGLAHEAGASVNLFTYKAAVTFHNPPGPLPRPLSDRLRAPMTGLGPGWRSLLCTKGPLLFHQMPESFRMKVVKRHLGPAAGWLMKDIVVGNVPLNVGHTLDSARLLNGRVRLGFVKPDGSKQTFDADHVIAGTGYLVDVDRLPFLHQDLKAAIATAQGAPILDSKFQSSVDGLYFVGAAAAASFGPLLRFVYGAGFTCRRIGRHLPTTVRAQVRRSAFST